MSNLRLQNTVVISFSHSKRALVPAGVPEKMARTREAMDARHVSQAFDAGRPELVERGRLIDGLMTTGEQVLVQEKATVRELEKSLRAAGWFLVDIHWYKKTPSPTKERNFRPKSKWIVNATYARLPPNYTPALPSIPEELIAPVWGLLVIWQNPNGTNVVNLTARAPHEHPEYSLEVEGGAFTTRPL